jgi:hypothetical protein
MPAGDSKRFELELRVGERPIRGRISERELDGQWDRSFAGWLGLLSAIEAASAAGERRPADTPNPAAKPGEDE